MMQLFRDVYFANTYYIYFEGYTYRNHLINVAPLGLYHSLHMRLELGAHSQDEVLGH